jgi:acetyltransferase-like isoleucine patch superfamily enzyme/lysophospholipase L1-like esterase
MVSTMTTIDAHAAARELAARFGDAIRVGEGCELAPDVCIEVDDDARLVIGDRVTVRRGTTIQVNRGAVLVIGNDVAIGDNVFLSAMVGIRIGDGVGVSNMVDIHDHNHRDRAEAHVSGGHPVPWESGFEGAPVIVESGAILANKVTVTAGVRIGQNSIIGANAVVTHSVPPNTVAAGVPARPIRSFDGPLREEPDRQQILARWFGTSIMEHFEGFNERMVNQADLPPVGSTVVVEGWRRRGYVHRLHLSLQATWPYLEVAFDNRGQGGATSRDVLASVQASLRDDTPQADLVFLGCGINDVWRGFQGRSAEAVGLAEFTENYREAVRLLTGTARRIVCIGETPFGWDADLDVTAMNAELLRYNSAAARIASDESASFLDVWPAFTASARQLAVYSPGSVLWSDGVHLSEQGDALMLQLVEAYLRENGTIAALTSYQRLGRLEAGAAYGHLFPGTAPASGEP